MYDIKICPNRFSCLTNPARKIPHARVTPSQAKKYLKNYCYCREKPIEYTFNNRMDLKNVAEFYKRDVCSKCSNISNCSEKMYRMKFLGINTRGKMWENAQSVNRSMYALFKYKVYCRKFVNGRKEQDGK